MMKLYDGSQLTLEGAEHIAKVLGCTMEWQEWIRGAEFSFFLPSTEERKARLDWVDTNIRWRLTSYTKTRPVTEVERHVAVHHRALNIARGSYIAHCIKARRLKLADLTPQHPDYYPHEAWQRTERKYLDSLKVQK